MNWDWKCKNCETEMDQIYENCSKQSRGCDIIAWCPKCGTVAYYYDSYNEPDNWYTPQVAKEKQ